MFLRKFKKFGLIFSGKYKKFWLGQKFRWPRFFQTDSGVWFFQENIRNFIWVKSIKNVG